MHKLTLSDLPPLQFPEVKSFGELFKSVRPFDKPEGKKSGERYVCFTHGEHRRSQWGVLKAKYETFIKEQMLSISGDSIFVSVALRDDNTALITFQYNQIIGSRWITIVPQDTLPK